MKFRYKGDVHLENLLGFDWDHGTVHDVTDAYAIRKLTNNTTLFEAVGEVPAIASPAVLNDMLSAPVEVPQMPKKRGPKPKLQLPEAE